MSRSRKSSPFIGITTCVSEKADKRAAAHRLRVATRVAIAADDEVLPQLREVSNVWAFGKDGKHRIDPAREPKLMRK